MPSQPHRGCRNRGRRASGVRAHRGQPCRAPSVSVECAERVRGGGLGRHFVHRRSEGSALRGLGPLRARPVAGSRSRSRSAFSVRASGRHHKEGEQMVKAARCGPPFAREREPWKGRALGGPSPRSADGRSDDQGPWGRRRAPARRALVCFAPAADDEGRGGRVVRRQTVAVMAESGASLRRWQMAAVAARATCSALPRYGERHGPGRRALRHHRRPDHHR
jgi:hypothetical protein